MSKASTVVLQLFGAGYNEAVDANLQPLTSRLLLRPERIQRGRACHATSPAKSPRLSPR